MNNNRLVFCIGFFLAVISLISLGTNAIVDMRGCFAISLALMAGGAANEALGE